MVHDKTPLFRGPYAVMHRAIEKSTGKNWAAQFIKMRPVDREMIKHSVELMNDLQHANILQIHEVFEQPGEMCIIFEL